MPEHQHHRQPPREQLIDRTLLGHDDGGYACRPTDKDVRIALRFELRLAGPLAKSLFRRQPEAMRRSHRND